MKKLSLLAIIFGLFLSLSAFAQIKTPKDENALTTEQKMLPFAMGMALSVLGEMHDEQHLTALTIFQKQIRYWSEELKPVVEMDKNIADFKRMDIALTATKALRAKSNDFDKWQMLVGEQFGTIYAMIKKNRTESKEINAGDLKFNLELIGILANKAPADVPWNVTAKFKEIGKLAEEKNLTSDKNIEKIIDEVKNILNTISKSKEK
jgi:hypothetical protein